METKYNRTDSPKLWRDMTDAEKGALLLAHHKGKVIEFARRGDLSAGWNRVAGGSGWLEDYAYRVRPEPKVETVTLNGNDIRFSWCLKGHRITFNLIDGKPDRASIKMEEL